MAIGSLVSGPATPTKSAAFTVAYAVLTQSLAHRELNWRLLRQRLADCAMLIAGLMLILGLALALTNYLVHTLAAMEAGFLCPPAGQNIYFASAMFNKSIGYVGARCLRRWSPSS